VYFKAAGDLILLIVGTFIILQNKALKVLPLLFQIKANLNSVSRCQF
jgi:hypothetical protein